MTPKKTLTGMNVRNAAASAQPPIESACVVDCTSALARWTLARLTSVGIIAPYAGAKKLVADSRMNEATTSAQSGRLPVSPATATGTSTIARTRSAATISRFRLNRSAASPPCSPKRNAGTLSASRTAITPPAPPTSNANHISAM